MIVTGPREAGKSTFCRHLVELARAAGRSVAGIVCPAVFEDGQKMAIEAETLRSGLRRQLATRRQAGSALPGISTRRWQFDPAVLVWGNQQLRKATPCEVLIVDELGPLEFERGEGWVAGLSALDSGDYRWGVVVIRPELLSVARQRWPAAEVIVVEQVAESDPAAQALARRWF